VFRTHSRTLEEVQVALNGLLNTKRDAFRRFFFLPNDDLLDVQKEGKNPPKVRPYMNKLFDNRSEDIDGILSSGKVPSLFDAQQRESSEHVPDTPTR
jgi:hypothetical protein